MRSYQAYKNKIGNSEQSEIIKKHTVFVQRIAYSLKYSLPKDIDFDDLIQIGLIALLEASSAYDASFGTTIESYAKLKVRGAMIDLIRKSMPLSKEKVSIIKKAQRYIESYQNEYYRSPKSKDIADYLGITNDKYQQLRFEYQSTFSVGIEEIELIEPNILSFNFNEKVDIDHDDIKSNLSSAISKLSEREQTVLSLYYFEELNLNEVAKIINVSESRISQILKNIKTKLRESMKEAFCEVV